MVKNLRPEDFGKKIPDKKPRATVLIASSFARLRQKYKEVLRGGFAVDEVSERAELERRMANDKPSVLLLDLALPRLGKGLSVFQRLSPPTKIILLAGPYDEGGAMKALKAGAKGYCNKRIESSLLRKAVNAVQKGEIWAGRRTITRLLEELPSLIENRQKNSQSLANGCIELLTPRECQIARLVGGGGSNKEIALQLNISERTVKAHLTAVFNKLQIPDRLRLGLLMAHHDRINR